MFPQSDEYDFRKIANDVTDATKTLLASELVDRRRVAVVGTEVGGYLSLASAEAEPQLYRCAVSIEGVYDWAALMGYFSDTRHQDGMYDRMERLLGDPHRDSEKFKALSVAATVDRLHIPVFVAYDAIEVFYEGQGKELASALEHAGVAHEAMQIGNDRFGINYLENKVELYRKLESFLDRNLKHAAD
jgi:dipeptidyl aminopeptidase/acylaminoacyl peptidase